MIYLEDHKKTFGFSQSTDNNLKLFQSVTPASIDLETNKIFIGNSLVDSKTYLKNIGFMLIHELIHSVLSKKIGIDTSLQFDNVDTLQRNHYISKIGL